MSDYQMGTIEARFADIIWEREPISSTELVRIAADEFDWKKSTTYTVLKRLCEKGIFKNEGGSVSGVITREEFYAARSEQFVEETFGGSLPAFIAAFTKRKALSKSELDELRRMVEEYEEESK
ncbi:MAG: BlaI/MecI/CopY family transcriptional regulator [Clostridia bacterium]|nr:BlaI/MecI/CopY family transcriptional regulator [Clostridia bacterium]